MNPTDLLDPDFRALAEQPEIEWDISPAALPATRELFCKVFEVPAFVVSSPTVDVQQVFAPGPADAPAVRCLVYRPTAPADGLRPAILDIHGGGFIIGKAEHNDLLNRAIVERLDCAVVAVDYRLSPEAPPLGAVEDCYAALQWLHAQADTLGVDRGRIAIQGESAGGGLAAALALLARDRGGPAIAFQLLYYPMLDDRTGSTIDRGPYAGFLGWTPEYNRQGWEMLTGTKAGSPHTSPYQAPARAKSLAGLPPTFIVVGSVDLFFEEDLEFAQRLARDGVRIELHVFPGTPHGFDRFFPDSDYAQAIARDADAALRRAFAA